LEEFLALEQLRKQEQELKELLIYSGPSWPLGRLPSLQGKSPPAERGRGTRGTATLWMIVLVVTILGIAVLALYLFLETR
jgi:hypothetical protein